MMMSCEGDEKPDIFGDHVEGRALESKASRVPSIEGQGSTQASDKAKRQQKRKQHRTKPTPKGMPRRPLSAYNLFFQAQRTLIIAERKAQNEAGADADNASGGDAALSDAPTSTIGNSSGDEAATAGVSEGSSTGGSSNEKAKKKGLFETMARTIAQRWKAASPEAREQYEKEAAKLYKKYRGDMEDYNKRVIAEYQAKEPVGQDDLDPDGSYDVFRTTEDLNTKPPATKRNRTGLDSCSSAFNQGEIRDQQQDGEGMGSSDEWAVVTEDQDREEGQHDQGKEQSKVDYGSTLDLATKPSTRRQSDTSLDSSQTRGDQGQNMSISESILQAAAASSAADNEAQLVQRLSAAAYRGLDSNLSMSMFHPQRAPLSSQRQTSDIQRTLLNLIQQNQVSSAPQLSILTRLAQQGMSPPQAQAPSPYYQPLTYTVQGEGRSTLGLGYSPGMNSLSGLGTYPQGQHLSNASDNSALFQALLFQGARVAPQQPQQQGSELLTYLLHESRRAEANPDATTLQILSRMRAIGVNPAAPRHPSDHSNLHGQLDSSLELSLQTLLANQGANFASTAVVPAGATDPRAGISTVRDETPKAGPPSDARINTEQAAAKDKERKVPPRKFVCIAIPSDKNSLSEYQCLLREQMCLFEANASDLQASAQGRNTPIRIGQVGLICRYCARIPASERGRGAVYYPAQLSTIYQAAQNMAVNHLFVVCPNIPVQTLSRLQELKDRKFTNARGTKQYWASAAQTLGVIEKDGGLLFTSRPRTRDEVETIE